MEKSQVKEITKKMFSKEQMFTIPNLLCLVRIFLIPFIIWAFFSPEPFYYFAPGLITLSALTDVIDGKIARKFHSVTNLGKALDPLADKLTQLAVAVCLAIRYALVRVLVALFVVKEGVMLLLGYLAMRKGEVKSARWYGKLNTVVLYLCMGLIVIWRAIPLTVANILIVTCMAMMVFTLVMYIIFYTSVIKGARGLDAESIKAISSETAASEIELNETVANEIAPNQASCLTNSTAKNEGATAVEALANAEDNEGLNKAN